MGLLTADSRRDTVVAWAFVAVQFGLLVVIAVLPAGTAWSLGPVADVVARVVQWAGAAVLVVAAVGLGRSLTPLPSPIPHGTLRTGGLYRFVRHPIYTGVVGLAGGLAARSGNPWTVVATAGLVVLFMAKARWEEVRLRRRYLGYEDYAARTPRFVPGWPFGADRRPA